MSETKEITKKEDGEIVEYGSFDLGDLEEVEKELPVGGGNFLKFAEGKTVIRFIPPRKGEKGVVTWYKHYFEAGGERKQIVCLKRQTGEHCPICAKGNKLKGSGNRLDAKRARAYEPRAYVYANVVNMKNPEKGPQTANFSVGFFKDIKAQIDASDVGRVFADPVKGYNIVVTRKGTGRNDTEYKVTVARESSELPNAAEIISTQADLSTIEEMPDDERLDEALDGDFADNGGGKGGKGDKGKSGGRSARKKDEDDDEEDADFEEI